MRSSCAFMEDDSSFPDHKLCGFLCAVLTPTCPHQRLQDPLRFSTRFYISRDNSEVKFRSNDGVVLSPVTFNSMLEPATEAIGSKEKCDIGSRKLGKKKVLNRGSKTSSKSGKRKRSIGLVHGSLSVVHQLHALVMHKCLQIDARLVWVEAGVGGEVRVVLLVDVYLPIELWSTGWQFPRSGSIAGALFRHLSCDWEVRNSMLASEDYCKDAIGPNRDMWNLSDCHVLGCKLHHNVTISSKKKMFELHEIFNTLPRASVGKGRPGFSRIEPVDNSLGFGIWEISDDILVNILSTLEPIELVRVAATCRHLRFLAKLIMPCMKLKLFPHQQAAVEWMLHREQHAKVLPHPLFMTFTTDDGFCFYINTISGEIITGIAPTINDFRGGMFCDEPGLGKTITALSLILKTKGTLADPPDGLKVIWCAHNGDQKCGYYELGGVHVSGGNMQRKREDARQVQRDLVELSSSISERAKLIVHNGKTAEFNDPYFGKEVETPASSSSQPVLRTARCNRSFNNIKKNLISAFEGASGLSKEIKVKKRSNKRKHGSDGPRDNFLEKQVKMSHKSSNNYKKPGKHAADNYESNDNWVQCDACGKWRKLPEGSIADSSVAWFCSMNTDPYYQHCSVTEESWDSCRPIMNLLGFHTKGTSGGDEQNIAFFTSVLKHHYSLINSVTMKALLWLVKLSPDKLSEMETIGLRSPFVSSYIVTGEDAHGFHNIFKAFGLRKGAVKGSIRWYYPRDLHKLDFDIAALRIALCEPLDSVRLYLSRATLIVVPSNLVDHWKTQIQKHVRPGQLRVYIWTDHRKPSAHCLAWDYDVVITTFSRLSAEWGPRKKSVMMQVHWHRVMLDEGHTLGSSVCLTNKLQMAVSLMATNRWILTGTPTPNTPNSQLSHLQPLLKFLHEETYGQNQKSWEAGILRPFEAELVEGRSRLLHLLHRCMISARKIDLQNLPPCIKKTTFLDFTEEHARSYNELVVTVRRNILMADWNDPSHVESLLNSKQWKFRTTTIKNVRLSCCVAGHIKVTDAGEDIQETMDILVEKSLDPKSEEYGLIKYNLLYGGDCIRCGEWCRLPVITPCRHLLCLACVSLDSEKCTYPGCGYLYEMQTPDSLTRPENPNPKWPVPKDLIELQPSYKQDNWDPDWQSTSSSKVTYLMQRLKSLCSSVVGHLDHNDDDATKTGEQLCSSLMHSLKVEKVLVFSQFLEHIHVIEQQLTAAGIKFAGMYSPMHSSNKMKSLATFQHDSSCTVLLMDGSAALGLDLSFVTHVFLMEPIWDRSMEEQVISRAHRMGATRPIEVETLAMRGTIEEQMLEFLQDANECRRFLKEELGKIDREGARTYRSLHDFAESNYLAQLSFVRTNSKM